MKVLNLFRQISQTLIFRSLILQPKSNFSQYFRLKDQQQVWNYNDRKILNKKYRGLIALWKKPLQKKRLRQARIKQIKANLPVPQPEQEKLVVHNPALGIKTPKFDQIFAVIRVDTRQFKVTNQCMIILDTKPDHTINQKMIFDVLMIGTQSYTVLGRPLVSTAKVQGVIQSISKSQKIIVFKKKRRKQYKKSFGSRVPLSSCRITNLTHNLTQELIERAVPLS